MEGNAGSESPPAPGSAAPQRDPTVASRGSRGPRIEALAAKMRGVSSLITSVLLLILLVAVVTTTFVGVLRDTVLIEPINVPQELAHRGYTPEVVAYRLMDEVMAIRSEYRSLKEGREVTADWMQADIQIPATGISFKFFLSGVRNLLGIPETRIGGEITRDGDVLRLRLRLNRARNHTPTQLVRSAANLDDLLHLGAQDLIKATDPYLLAHYIFQRDPHAAMELIEYCLAHEPPDDDPWAYNLWGLFYMSKDDLEQAEKMFRKALALKPDFPATYSNWGLLHALRGQYSEADTKFQKALTIDPKMGVVYSGWGMSYALIGKEEKAERNFAKAIELAPDNPRIYLARGVALSRLGKEDEGMKAVQKALSLSPNFVVAHGFLGDYHFNKESYPDAVRHYEAVTRPSPYFAERVSWRYWTALSRWGEDLAKQKEIGAAIEKYEHALTLRPRDARLRERIARLKAEREAARTQPTEGQYSK